MYKLWKKSHKFYNTLTQNIPQVVAFTVIICIVKLQAFCMLLAISFTFGEFFVICPI